MEGLTEGRIVHFVMPGGQHRPAIVVRVWDKNTGYCNLQVFLDGTNDCIEDRGGLTWETSVSYSAESKEPRTWHWPERA